MAFSARSTVENDLVCEDWRSRDRSWDYCRIAINFYHEHKIPFVEMKPADSLVGGSDTSNDKYCFAKPDDTYLVYLADGRSTEIDLSNVKGSFQVRWFNPRQGGPLKNGSVVTIVGGRKASIGLPPSDVADDWLAVIRR